MKKNTSQRNTHIHALTSAGQRRGGPLRLLTACRVPILACCILTGVTISQATAQPALRGQSSGESLTGVKMASLSRAIGSSPAAVTLKGTVSVNTGKATETHPIQLFVSALGETQMTIAGSTDEGANKAWPVAGNPRGCASMKATARKPKGDTLACLNPVSWVLPTFALADAKIAKSVIIDSVGATSSSGKSRIVSIYPDTSSFGSTMQSILRSATVRTLVIESDTALPKSLSYSEQVAPSSGTRPSAIEIKYTDYRKTTGVMLPRHIQRWVDGALVLDITIDTVDVQR